MNLVEPFDIEEGDLDGLAGDYVWCLAVDWADFRQKLMTEPGPFEFRTHSPNRDRFAKMAERHGRTLQFRMMPGWEDWLDVFASAPPAEGPR